ncbi:MAG: ATP-binding protein [Candidatus Aenigmarchaeota archaeon]|nr:ATP-binding protein [Candidatus Aenigmarchaeota archaeon]
MKSITVLSGKGGVGKSMLASSLAVLLAGERKIVAADCDVDAPNLGLSLGLNDDMYDTWKEITTNKKALLKKDLCTGCKECLGICAFGAITWDKSLEKPVFNNLKCEGCGACLIACPNNAIKLESVKNAKIGIGKTKYGFPIVTGQMKMGHSGSGKVVFYVKKKAQEIAQHEKSDLMLIDAAAGIGCPVIASIQGSDYVIAVTEPTPSALNDLKRALSVVNHFGIRSGIVINKFDLNEGFSKKIEKFSAANGIRLLGKIPYSRKFVEALVNLEPVVDYDKGFETVFRRILGGMEKAKSL